VCGDGLDNDCDGAADRGVDGDGVVECSPYDMDGPDRLTLDAASIDAANRPRFGFPNGAVTGLDYAGAPGSAWMVLPLTDDLTLELPITDARAAGDFASLPGGPGVVNGRIGGILSAKDLDAIFGLEVTEIGLTPEDSMLDAFFANLLGTLVGLPNADTPLGSCKTPDIDVDGDGLEAFCDSDPLDEINRVDVCVDGDGTIVADTDAVPCTTDPRFVDGISIEINFEAVPATLESP
jgi:hypothetical protein